MAYESATAMLIDYSSSDSDGDAGRDHGDDPGYSNFDGEEDVDGGDESDKVWIVKRNHRENVSMVSESCRISGE